MIHHELGCAYVLDRDGAKVTIDVRTPRDAMLSAEEQDEPSDALACAIEAVKEWLAWIFEAGPHPVPVMRRLVACTTANAPWLMVGMPAKEARAVSVTASQEVSLRDVCRTTPGRVRRALMDAYAREGRTWTGTHVLTMEMRVILECLMDEGEKLIRARAMETWLARVWDAGPKLGDALKALFVEARAIAPELILNMSGSEISAMFGQGRAAESARVKQRVNAEIMRAGFRRAPLRFQKSLGACRTYAACAKGNRNRARSAEAAA